MSSNSQKPRSVPALVLPSDSSTSSNSSGSSSLSPTGRSTRFAEATSVYSPADRSAPTNPFADPASPAIPYMSASQPVALAPPASTGQVGDIGFGYIQPGAPIATQTVDAKPTTNGPKSALKSALKTAGAPPRHTDGNPLSPTFREDQLLEKAELMTDKEQEKDLRIKARVRLAKIILRGVNFSCSLIVLSLLATTFQIFNVTKHLAPRNGLPPWSRTTPMWPQITLLVIACISLVFATVIIYYNIRHGHRRAEKVAVYYTTFAVAFFVFNIVMWGVGAAILSGVLNSSNGQDMWGWACKDNRRKQLFEKDISYGVVCRLQNWALLCAIIEIVIELFIISIYGFVFYRFWSKRRLRKSMAIRDRARSDLYLAQLRSQSVPNTPALMSPRSAMVRGPRTPGFMSPEYTKADEARFVMATPQDEKPFSLQPAPRSKKGTSDSSPISTGSSPSVPFANCAVVPGMDTVPMSQGTFFPTFIPPSAPAPDRTVQHSGVLPGEQQYAAVPIPGAYLSPAPVRNQPSNPTLTTQSSGETLASQTDNRYDNASR